MLQHIQLLPGRGVRGLLRLCVVVCWVVVAVSQGNSQSDVRTVAAGSRAARAVVRIYDFENVPPSILARAEEEATDIFGEAGIAVAWLKCWPRSAEREPGCGLPFGPADLMVRILNKPMTAGFGLSPVTLGFALPIEDGRGGVTAYVCYDHIRQLVYNRDSSTSYVLGVVAAHELGHLLMASKAHSTGGIMRPVWPKKDLPRRRSGYFVFTAAEAELMRANLLWRLQHGNGSSMPVELQEPDAGRKGRIAALLKAVSPNLKVQ